LRLRIHLNIKISFLFVHGSVRGLFFRVFKQQQQRS
jgi:hypothetical protein